MAKATQAEKMKQAVEHRAKEDELASVGVERSKAAVMRRGKNVDAAKTQVGKLKVAAVSGEVEANKGARRFEKGEEHANIYKDVAVKLETTRRAEIPLWKGSANV